MCAETEPGIRRGPSRFSGYHKRLTVDPARLIRGEFGRNSPSFAAPRAFPTRPGVFYPLRREFGRRPTSDGSWISRRPVKILGDRPSARVALRWAHFAPAYPRPCDVRGSRYRIRRSPRGAPKAGRTRRGIRCARSAQGSPGGISWRIRRLPDDHGESGGVGGGPIYAPGCRAG